MNSRFYNTNTGFAGIFSILLNGNSSVSAFIPYKSPSETEVDFNAGSLFIGLEVEAYAAVGAQIKIGIDVDKFLESVKFILCR